MSSHRSLATGRKPEPLACCRSEGGRGSILLADAKWTAPLGHTMHNTGGPLGIVGDGVEADKKRECVRVRAHRHLATQPDTSTQPCCTGAAAVWFIANEYLPSVHAVSETAPAHGGNRGVGPPVTESCKSISNTSSCQGEGFTLHACVLLKGGLHICTCIFMCVRMYVASGTSFIPNGLWQGAVWVNLICRLCCTLLLGVNLHYPLIIGQDYKTISMTIFFTNVSFHTLTSSSLLQQQWNSLETAVQCVSWTFMWILHFTFIFTIKSGNFIRHQKKQLQCISANSTAA